MRITARQLRQIIKEELSRTMREADETEMPAMNMPVDKKSIVTSALKELPSIQIVRRGPSSWNESYNAPGPGKILWNSSGSGIVAFKWVGEDGKTFFIIQAAGITTSGEPVVGQSREVQPDIFLTFSELTGGQVERLDMKTIIEIPAMLKVGGSPGGGMFKKQEVMALEFTVM